MSGMFYNSSFNSDISNWDVSSVQNMRAMFNRAKSFNGDLSKWDVSSVRDMGSMFFEANSFEGTIGEWDVSKVTNMGAMFAKAAKFNGDLSRWDVSSVTMMGQMFENAQSFKGEISDWNTSSVTNMYSMFEASESFNGDLSEWNVSSVTDMYRMLNKSGLSQENYDRLLIGWSELPLQSDVTFGAEGLTYTGAGEEGRNILINEFGWNIVGDIAGEGTAKEVEQTPITFSLKPNYPNPFNPNTTISYELAEPSLVRLEVFTVLGQRVAVLVDRYMHSGSYSVDFDASELASGKYLYRLTAGDFVQTRQMTLIK
jgi:surface protein